jgi:hypothetical protein
MEAPHGLSGDLAVSKVDGGTWLILGGRPKGTAHLI